MSFKRDLDFSLDPDSVSATLRRAMGHKQITLETYTSLYSILNQGPSVDEYLHTVAIFAHRKLVPECVVRELEDHLLRCKSHFDGKREAHPTTASQMVLGGSSFLSNGNPNVIQRCSTCRRHHSRLPECTLCPCQKGWVHVSLPCSSCQRFRGDASSTAERAGNYNVRNGQTQTSTQILYDGIVGTIDLTQSIATRSAALPGVCPTVDRQIGGTTVASSQREIPTASRRVRADPLPREEVVHEPPGAGETSSVDSLSQERSDHRRGRSAKPVKKRKLNHSMLHNRSFVLDRSLEKPIKAYLSLRLRQAGGTISKSMTNDKCAEWVVSSGENVTSPYKNRRVWTQEGLLESLQVEDEYFPLAPKGSDVRRCLEFLPEAAPGVSREKVAFKNPKNVPIFSELLFWLEDFEDATMRNQCQTFVERNGGVVVGEDFRHDAFWVVETLEQQETAFGKRVLLLDEVLQMATVPDAKFTLPAKIEYPASWFPPADQDSNTIIAPTVAVNEVQETVNAQDSGHDSTVIASTVAVHEGETDNLHDSGSRGDVESSSQNADEQTDVGELILPLDGGDGDDNMTPENGGSVV